MVDEPAPGRLMAREMAEQPDVLTRLVARRDAVGEAVRAAAPRDLRGILLLARGSSDHAAVYARYALELASRKPAALGAPSLFTRYGARTALDGFLAIAVSQSGRTPEIVETLEASVRCGARALALTNEAGSPLEAAAHATITLEAGVERAVPATKTFSAQVAAFALVAQALGDAGWEREWPRAIAAVADVLADGAAVRSLAGRLLEARRFIQVGRGHLYSVALEAGWKIAETTGIGAAGFSPADLRHGPIAATGPGLSALCFATPGPVLDDVADVTRRLARRGTTVVAVCESGELLPGAAEVLTVPAGLPEGLAPLAHVVRGQQLARELALAQGRDPDRPLGLTKVTPTT